jgi:predicted  nucleic acid-binding Zn-ribbon protein
MLTHEAEKLAESRSFQSMQDQQLLEEQDQIRQSKQRLNTVKNTRELNATQREIESTRRLAQTREEELAKVAAAIEGAEQRIATMEKGLEDLREQFSSERQKLDKEGKKLQRLLDKAQKSRASLQDAVETTLLRTYERIRTKSGGIAFVPVRERRCTACKMHVAHQTYTDLRKGDIVPICESCGRLLYWAGLFPEELDRLRAKEAGDTAPRKKNEPKAAKAKS